MTGGKNRCAFLLVIALVAWGAVEDRAAHAAAFGGYALTDHFLLPAGAGPFDVLADGRLITLVGVDVYVESAARSREFVFCGTLPDADIASFGAAFVCVSPDGTKIAVGNNGGGTLSAVVEQAMQASTTESRQGTIRGQRLKAHPARLARRLLASGAAEVAGTGVFEVGMFNLADLSGQWFAAVHFDAAWIDDRYLAITGGDFGSPAVVTALDTQSVDPADPANPVIIDNIGGAPGGIAFDAAGNLLTGNGFSTTGPSGTGLIKAFAAADWMAAMSGGTPPDFESDGTVIVDVLSASPLDFDAEENLLVGGGDLFGSGEGDFVAVIRADAVDDAVDGLDPVEASDPTQVQRLDPDTDNAMNFYSVRANPVTGELYLRDAVVFVLEYGRGRGTGPVIFVRSQSLYFDSILATEPAPGRGRFQLLEVGQHGLETEYGPGDRGYLGGRWKGDFDGDGEFHYFVGPLLPPGRQAP